MGSDEEKERLRRQLKESEEETRRAARAGLDLLQQQAELEERLEEQRVEMTNELEALEQEKYSLQKEVELKSRMLESLQLEYENATRLQRRQLEEQQEHLERSHGAALSEHQNKILALQTAVEEYQLSEKQLKHKLEVQAEALSNKTEELRALSEKAHNSTTSETMEAQLKLLELENAKAELERTLQESRYREQQLELSRSRLQRQLEHVAAEKEERQQEAVSCFNALEKARELNRDLQIQLDQVLQQAQDPNSRGSSLFAELEDKRAAMERQLISMKVQHQSLQKTHAFTKQQMQRMKVQMATLMQLQGSRADPAQLERLQSMVAEKNSEIQSLMTKLQRLEGMEALMKCQPAHRVQAEAAEGQDETYYTDLLQLQLSNSVKDVKRLGDELSLQRMKALSESQRTLELERKLYTAERLLKQAQSDKYKLQVRVEELQEKYEPQEVKKNLIQRRRKEKLPFEPRPEAEGEEPRGMQAVVMETASGEGENRPTETSAAAQEPDLRPAKCVKISGDEPEVVPAAAPSRCLTEVKEEQEENGQRSGQEARRRKPQVEVIYVSADKSMENQCSQQ